MPADSNSLYTKQHSSLEDFWGRRENGPRFAREFRLFGRPARMTANDERVLAALDHVLPLYSVAPQSSHAPYSIHLIVRETYRDVGPLPDNLSEHLRYTGHGDWLDIQLGAWGHCHVDLRAGRALAVLAPALAARPDLVSHHLLNTIFTNLLQQSGFGMMHCTGLLRGDHALLLMAPHNSGKSTTALRLVLAGYSLLSDSQVYVAPDGGPLTLLGFPVGRIKLRRDVVPEFPELQPLLAAEMVRGETKFSVDIRRLNPALVCEEAIRPAKITLCLLTRSEKESSALTPATREEVMDAIMQNSIFYDTATAWARNLAPIERCVARARWHHLSVGRDPAGIVESMQSLSRNRIHR
ncbi:MAG: hypothetical protein ACRDIB_19280 [Ardenticatenaceae bacterium]